jgi:uncharacterized membrane protein
MKTLVSTWLLAGGLAASLAWNVRAAWCPAPAAPGGCVETAASCSIDLADLGLSDEQRRSLERSGAAACAESERLVVRASELQAELCGHLAAPDVDVEAVRGLAREIGDLRRRSLEACIDSVLEVRALLGAEQVERLFASCSVSCKKPE